MNSKIQVQKEHYSPNYDLGDRFYSYKEQIKLIVALKPKKILEIGGGNQFLSNYLKMHKYHVKNLDIDKNLKPDYVGDVRDMSIIKNNEYDVICAFQILEHIPFKDFELALKNLKQKSKKNILISLPYSNASTSLNFKFHAGPIKINKTLLITIPFFFHKIDIKKNKQHYWEVGSKGYSRKKIKKIISKHLKLEKEYVLKSNPYHIFYVLTK